MLKVTGACQSSFDIRFAEKGKPKDKKTHNVVNTVELS